MTVLCTHISACTNVHAKPFYVHENQYTQIWNFSSPEPVIVRAAVGLKLGRGLLSLGHLARLLIVLQEQFFCNTLLEIWLVVVWAAQCFLQLSKFNLQFTKLNYFSICIEVTIAMNIIFYFSVHFELLTKSYKSWQCSHRIPKLLAYP